MAGLLGYVPGFGPDEARIDPLVGALLARRAQQKAGGMMPSANAAETAPDLQRANAAKASLVQALEAVPAQPNTPNDGAQGLWNRDSTQRWRNVPQPGADRPQAVLSGSFAASPTPLLKSAAPTPPPRPAGPEPFQLPATPAGMRSAAMMAERMNPAERAYANSTSGDERSTIATHIRTVAQDVGVDPADLATVISYETGGSFNPTIQGGAGGRHRGLIQWGPNEAQEFLGGDFSIPSQARGMAAYLKQRGVKPGMGMLDLYSAVNAGRVGRYDASDAANGGAPGTVRDKVETQMGAHRRNAMDLLGMNGAGAGTLAGGAGRDTLMGGPGVDPIAAARGSEGVVRYANQSATRNQPVTPLLQNNLQSAVAAVYGPGAYASVYSGGQDGKRRTGSRRHDHGMAADVHIYGADGKQIRGDALAPLAQHWLAQGYGSAGLEMRGGGIHLDQHTKDTLRPGEALSWSYANRGGAYTPAMRAAVAAGLAGKGGGTMGGSAGASTLAGGSGSDTIAGGNEVTAGQGTSAERRRALAEVLMSSFAPPPPSSAGTTITAPQPRATTEEAALQPIVAGGGSVRNISFGTGGGGGAVPSSEAIDRRRTLAEALMKRGSQAQATTIPSGIASLVDTAVGGFGMLRAEREEERRRDALVQALRGSANGGSLDPLYDVDPVTAYKMQAAREAQAYERDQAELTYQRELAATQQQRQYTLEDDARDQRQALELRQFDVDNRAPAERWEPYSVDGRTGQRSTTTGKIDFDPTPPQPPSDVGEYQFYAEQERAAGRQPLPFGEYQTSQRRAGATTIAMPDQNANAGDKKFREAMGAASADSLSAIVTAGRGAQNRIADLDTMSAALDRTPGGWRNGALRMASSLGINLGEGQSEVELADALISKVAPTLREPGSGSSSDRDVSIYMRALPSLMNSERGNKLIIRGLRTMAQSDQQRSSLILQMNDQGASPSEIDAALQRLPSPMANIHEMLLDIPETLGAEDRQKAKDLLLMGASPDEVQAAVDRMAAAPSPTQTPAGPMPQAIQQPTAPPQLDPMAPGMLGAGPTPGAPAFRRVYP